jgi:putative AlgH/UPF0301 family transcriptional regulator
VWLCAFVPGKTDTLKRLHMSALFSKSMLHLIIAMPCMFSQNFAESLIY